MADTSDGNVLTFDVVDDALLGLELGVEAGLEALRVAETRALGPIVELLAAQRSSAQSLPGLSALQPSPAVEAVQRGLSREPNREVAHSRWPRKAEVTRVESRGPASAADPWDIFCLRAQHAAQRCGLSRSTAQGLTAAIRELEDNVQIHSGKPHTGLVGYRWESGEFEFIVADAGIGVLESLRQCSDYSDLSDSGTALGLAVTDGESRLGRDSGHGYGFRPLFVGMANLYGHLRFRSGDHCLVIDGRSPDRIGARVSQRPEYPGMQISITCVADSPSKH